MSDKEDRGNSKELHLAIHSILLQLEDAYRLRDDALNSQLSNLIDYAKANGVNIIKVLETVILSDKKLNELFQTLSKGLLDKKIAEAIEAMRLLTERLKTSETAVQLKLSNENLTTKVSEAMSANHDLTNKVVVLDDKLKRLEQEYEILDEENKELIDRIKKMQEECLTIEESKRLANELDDLRKLNQGLINDRAAVVTESDKRKEQIDSLTAQNAEMAEELVKLKEISDLMRYERNQLIRLHLKTTGQEPKIPVRKPESK